MAVVVVSALGDSAPPFAKAGHSRRPVGLGIIGFRRFGRRAAKKAYRAKPLAVEMKIVHIDVVRMPADIERETAATYEKDVATLLATSDCVVAATPSAATSCSAPRGKLIDEPHINPELMRMRNVGLR
ncbi:Uu.00g108880.m01.CDS01 [Anthostomella pinea]|uniref:Uu.00g108880.m01.CDS01 n=1 Tax=Anthostomella pinea TaxID=933095 RepID=A0AAI8YG50_9PEZI|nr:Uu.00g108880.m01.CDS01 [Anthostomella pinea]